jgi:hypothetical protein
MPIMYWPSKAGQLLVFILSALVAVSAVAASDTSPWVSNKQGAVAMRMTDGSVYTLKLPPDVDGMFYDRSKHLLEGQSYVAVFQVLPSNPEKPLGFCGAGSEVWLSVYKIVGAKLDARTKVLVSSCLHSISLVSQNSGEETQDTDFSSVKWDEQGFSIEWFSNADAKGRPLSSTQYRLQEGVFTPLDVLDK